MSSNGKAVAQDIEDEILAEGEKPVTPRPTAPPADPVERKPSAKDIFLAERENAGQVILATRAEIQEMEERLKKSVEKLRVHEGVWLAYDKEINRLESP